LFFFQYVSDYVLPLTTKKLTAITTQSITQKAILFGLEDFELNDMAASKSRWNPFLVQSIQMVCSPLTALHLVLYRKDEEEAAELDRRQLYDNARAEYT